MARCLRDCENCEYEPRCKISCTEQAIAKRYRHMRVNENMVDGIKGAFEIPRLGFAKGTTTACNDARGHKAHRKKRLL